MSGKFKPGNYIVGQRVSTFELSSNTENTYFLLVDLEHNVEHGGSIGTIAYIGEKQNRDMLKVYNECRKKYNRKPMIFINESSNKDINTSTENY